MSVGGGGGFPRSKGSCIGYKRNPPVVLCPCDFPWTEQLFLGCDSWPMETLNLPQGFFIFTLSLSDHQLLAWGFLAVLVTSLPHYCAVLVRLCLSAVDRWLMV